MNNLLEKTAKAIASINGSKSDTWECCVPHAKIALHAMADWISPQRNDIPVTGEEIAVTIRYQCQKEDEALDKLH